jgi:hypothetical protein
MHKKGKRNRFGEKIHDCSSFVHGRSALYSVIAFESKLGSFFFLSSFSCCYLLHFKKIQLEALAYRPSVYVVQIIVFGE